MATAAQIAANRLNAQKSTGPRTAQGKAVVSQNAITHGLLAREGVLRGEDEDQFEEHRERLLGQLCPAGPLEEILATRIVDLTWRLKRAVQDQEEAFAALYDRHTGAAPEPGNAALPSGIGKKANPDRAPKRDPLRLGTQVGGPRGATLGQMLVEDFSGPAVLERLLRYERRIESSLYRSLTELRRVHDQCQKADQEVVQTLDRWREEDGEARKTRAFGWGRPADSSEEVSGVNCEVPGEIGRGRPTHEEPPDGGSTNSPPVESTQHSSIPSFQDSSHTPEPARVESQSCETNPKGGGRLEDRLCETKPIREEFQVGSVKFQADKANCPALESSNFKLHTSNFTLPTSVWFCERACQPCVPPV